jgi:ornithine cyclodeaminase
MPTVRLLSEADLRAAVPLDPAAVDCVESAFRALAGGGVVMPPILSMAIHEHNGEVDVKTAFVPGLESFALKISPGYFDNPKLGLPSTSGLMILFAARTGQVEAVLLDNGYLTDVRTAAAGAVAARHLARPDATRAAILGTGMQARLQLRALALVRRLERASIWGRNAERAEALAAEMARELGIEVRARDAGEAVADADIVVTTTPATEPVLRAAWLRPGQHVTAMGSDQPTKNEVEPAALARADLYVPDRLAQTRMLGELRAALAAGAVTEAGHHPELGDIVAGRALGRTDAAQITLADLTGTGVQDTAIATLARQRALAAGAGTDFDA